MKTTFAYVLITSFLFLTNCYSGDKTLVPRPEAEVVTVEESYPIKFEPKVDIVFVVDNSGSMSSHQRNLAANMGLFTAAMEQNKFLDYHIGVMNTSSPSGGIWGNSSNEITGELQGNPQFVTRQTTNGLRLLANTVDSLGTSGNATEKMFDPIYEGLAAKREKINPGFLRTEAFLVVILVTDAEDQSEISTGFQAYNELVRLKTGNVDKVLGYAALSDPSYFRDQCQTDYGGWGSTGPEKNYEFMSYFTNAENSRVAINTGSPNSKTRTNVFSLCDSQYGQILANIGMDIRYRVSQILPLPHPPVPGTIKLKYGSRYVSKKWWKYNPATQSLILDPDIELVEEKDAQFSVVMDQADLTNPIGTPPSNL